MAFGAVDDGLGGGVPSDFLEGERMAQKVFRQTLATGAVVGGHGFFAAVGEIHNRPFGTRVAGISPGFLACRAWRRWFHRPPGRAARAIAARMAHVFQGVRSGVLRYCGWFWGRCVGGPSYRLRWRRNRQWISACAAATRPAPCARCRGRMFPARGFGRGRPIMSHAR